MVPRLLAAGAAIALLIPSAAGAANTRVSIANYAWSQPRVSLDLGEKVTWDWLGPDLAHSVTGISANSLRWDSDAGTDAPAHRAGDSFTIQFGEPGEYLFQCKLHAAVRGEVVVSDVPGDPGSDPGPQPPLNLDLKPPTLGSLSLPKRRARGGGGLGFSVQISERGRLDAEYYRFNSKGRRIYNGFETWRAFIGINHLRLGARSKHFRARPGRYLAVLRATDEAANESKPLRRRFTIG
ncbi:MAG TPA: plastocyanin/azurin family copper-binding protein [Solirubrobacterales bacterium]|nr:plastocyanin/azurin family copper-binding protein [Solirubrobacterales bacterium]